MKLRGILTAASFCSASLTVFAHPSDVSYLQVKMERQRVELRLTFNLLTLTRFVAIDRNRDHRIDKAELDRAEPALRQYLESHIQVRINDQPSVLGTPISLACVWPSPDAAHQAGEADYGQRYVDFVFVQDVKPVLEDIWLGFDIWKQTGPLGAIEAIYEQDKVHTNISFSENEPDYLHDTGYPTATLEASAPLPTPVGSLLLRALCFTTALGVALAVWRRKQYGRPPP